MTDMTPPNLDAIQARANAATSGPWVHSDRTTTENVTRHSWDVAMCPGGETSPGGRRDEQAFADADFIAHARTDIPALIARIRELEAERDNARTALAEAQVATLEELLDPEVGWKLRGVVEDELIEWRDAGRSILGRGNGLSINYADGTRGPIRFGFETALLIAIRAHMEKSSTPKHEEAKTNE